MTLDYLKSHNKFSKDLTTSKALSRNEKLTFSEMEPVEENLGTVPEKVTENELRFTL